MIRPTRGPAATPSASTSAPRTGGSGVCQRSGKRRRCVQAALSGGVARGRPREQRAVDEGVRAVAVDEGLGGSSRGIAIERGVGETRARDARGLGGREAQAVLQVRGVGAAAGGKGGQAQNRVRRAAERLLDGGKAVEPFRIDVQAERG